MGFASEWLQKGSLFPRLIPEEPSANTGIIIVVPAYDEPGITTLLSSLAGCEKPSCDTEVIIIVNAPAGAEKAAFNNNLLTVENVLNWNRTNPDSFFRLYCIDLGQPDFKKWGVGHARKSGMDEALRRFDILDKPEGVIANLDGDCTVRKDYLKALEKDLLSVRGRNGCSVFFEHPISGEGLTEAIYRSVIAYEIHLRYFNIALRYSGYPDVYHTVGSSLAVKALPYMRSGGMNRRQAGEDFYFIQKLIPIGGYFNLNTTSIYPSPRASFRVPFGTGASISKMERSGRQEYLTYNPLAFSDLRFFFGMIGDIYTPVSFSPEVIRGIMPDTISAFLNESDWVMKINEIKTNTSGFPSFRKRFFNWFNMFRIVKFLNYIHRKHYSRIPSDAAAIRMLCNMGLGDFPEEPRELLIYLREIERKS